MLIVGPSVRMWCPLVFMVLAVHFPAPVHGQVAAPRRLRFRVLGPSKLHVSWKEPKGDFDSYTVLYNSEPGEEEKQLRVSKGENKVVINDFDAMREYYVKVIAVNGDQQSRALRGKYSAEDLDGGSEGEGTLSQRLKNAGGAEDINEIAGEPGSKRVGFPTLSAEICLVWTTSHGIRKMHRQFLLFSVKTTRGVRGDSPLFNV